MAKSKIPVLPRTVVIALIFAFLLTGFIIYLVATLGSGETISGSNRQTAPKSSEAGPFTGAMMYVDPDSNAARQAKEWSATRATDSKRMAQLASLPAARWLGDAEDFSALKEHFLQVEDSGNVAVTVLYNIPGRDCGLYSAGGAESAAAYRSFIDSFVAAAGSAKQMVIIEPDALAQLEEKAASGKPCLTTAERKLRLELLSYAVTRIDALENSHAYIDAGNSGWDITPKDMAERLRSSNIEAAAGFSLNISNFRKTDETVAYGRQLSAELEGAHFVVDTSRNGLGPFDNKARPDFGWCNPPGRALGHYPTFDTGIKSVDAFLYIKGIGESDGSDPDPLKCFTGPEAGEWSPEYALGLMQRWPSYLQPREYRDR